MSRLQATLTVPHEIVVIDDASENRSIFAGLRGIRLHRLEQPHGSGRSKDFGIALCRYDTVLVMDAHMNVPEHAWAEPILYYLRQHPRDVACFVCPLLWREQRDLPSAPVRRYGARLFRHATFGAEEEDGATGSRIYCRVPVAHRWNDSKTMLRNLENGSVQSAACVLGGAYAFRRELYMETLMRPWRMTSGWGYEEQHLSIHAYLYGGRCVVLPIEIGHIFGYEPAYRRHLADILHNAALVPELYAPERLRAQNLQALLGPWAHTPLAAEVHRRLQRPAVQSRRQALAPLQPRYGKFLERHVGPPLLPRFGPSA